LYIHLSMSTGGPEARSRIGVESFQASSYD
jgi:hypothetical protein